MDPAADRPGDFEVTPARRAYLEAFDRMLLRRGSQAESRQLMRELLPWVMLEGERMPLSVVADAVDGRRRAQPRRLLADILPAHVR